MVDVRLEEPTFVPRLSTIRVLMPQRAIHVAIIMPAGPAPTMRTSTLLSGEDMVMCVYSIGSWDVDTGYRGGNYGI